MATYVACSYQIEGSEEWGECDEEYMLFDTEEEFNEQIENVLQMLSEDTEDPASTVTFRFETWKEDENLELKGDAEYWSVKDIEDSEGDALFESAESAATYMAESEGTFKVRKLVRTNFYGFKTVALNKKAFEGVL